MITSSNAFQATARMVAKLVGNKSVPAEPAVAKPAEPVAVPYMITKYLQWIQEHGVDEKGIFRTSANSNSDFIKDQTARYRRGGRTELPKTLIAEDISHLVKTYFRDLKPPIFSREATTKLLVANFADTNHETNDNVWKEVLNLVETQFQDVIRELLATLHKVAQNSEVNKMTPENLAIVWVPNLFTFSDNLTVELSEQTKIRKWFEYLIENAPKFLPVKVTEQAAAAA